MEPEGQRLVIGMNRRWGFVDDVKQQGVDRLQTETAVYQKNTDISSISVLIEIPSPPTTRQWLTFTLKVIKDLLH